MLFSKILIPKCREVSSDIEAVSTKLMIKSGMIRKLASGVYEFLPLGLKALRKIENIIRREMNAIGGQEISLPLISPKSLLIETGRWSVYGKELFKLMDRKRSEFCLVPTSEELITDLIRKEIKSYKQLPIMLYQFGTKFRDEIRPRFGVLRSREFLMKDAYSFHVDEIDLEKYYKIMFDAYTNICIKCGFKFRAVEASSGSIGGSFSHEFIVLADTGEEEIVWCSCGYGANSKKAECLRDEQVKEKELPIEETFTPNISFVEDVANFFQVSKKKIIKTMIYIVDKNPVAVLIRGDHEVSEIKLQSLLYASEVMIADKQIIACFTKAPIGFLGPLGLKNLKIVADLSVIGISNAIIGANKENYHIKNLNYKRDYSVDVVADLRKITIGEICPKCKRNLRFSKGIEIGHIFKLGTKYSKSMNAMYIDVEGKRNFIVMGCYGIGVTRILAATIEQSYDNNGIIWPANIAPFEVVIIPVSYKNEQIMEKAEKICKELSLKGLDVLIDDRAERLGVKFKDADLMGIPYRVTISEKNLLFDNIEFKARKDGKEGIKFFKHKDLIHELIRILKV
ncbi:MAG: proline--tRNA ligase [Endomicrobium sp.]|jgi:prolyl-tRNA synthetase|nr:proline--tRNA ligase [Endomicrobium sp.]